MVLKDGHKMSKSLGNTVDPNHLIQTYGADTARLFSMFAAPPEQSLEWSDSGVEGAYRFLKRLWVFVHENESLFHETSEMQTEPKPMIDWQALEPRLKKARAEVHHIIAQASIDYERNQFNTVVSACMKLFNCLSAYDVKTAEDTYFLYDSTTVLLRLLAPITPHICHVLWKKFHFSKPIIDAQWPKYDKNALKMDEIDFVVQVNGKLRAQFTAQQNLSEVDLIDRAKKEAFVFINGKNIKKTIVVSHRQLINLVIES